MSSLALLGFVTIGLFLVLTLFTRLPVVLALILTPVAAATLGGFGGEIGGLAVEGMKTVAPVAAMIMFAVLYFGLMMDVGLFEPMIRRVVQLVREDPVRLCLASAALPMLVALDGDGATTFLISVTALLPIHRRLGLNPLVLPAIVGLAAGVMNLLPWGGPTARAMAALDASVADIFVPVLPAMIAGIGWVFLVAWMMGRRERRRLGHDAQIRTEADVETGDRWKPGGVFWFNLALTSLVILGLFRDVFLSVIALPDIPAPLLFMAAFAIALPFNRRSLEAQQAQLAAHAPAVVAVLSMIFAAGIFTGILGGTGMIGAMAQTFSASTPPSMAPWLGEAVAITGMPLSLLFPPDAYYFGVVPVFADAARAMGEDPLTIGRAAILGQMTTGFPLSPLTASTFILVGLTGVSLRDHQRFTFVWAFGTTLVMTLVASVTGAI